MKKVMAISAAAWLSCVVPALALGYTDQTVCSDMSLILNQDSPSHDDVMDAVNYIEGVFTDLDSGHVENGDPGIAAKWSDKGMIDNVSLVATWCDKHPKETVYNASAEVYNGLRSMEMSLGAAQ